MSSHKHFENEEHNADYDHEAFLGDEAKAFDQLSPEESKERLGYVKTFGLYFQFSKNDQEFFNPGKLWTKLTVMLMVKFPRKN